MRYSHIGIGAAALALCVGCGSKPGAGTQAGGSLTLQGSIPSSQRTLDNARVVGIGANGRTFWAYFDASGAFRITLPAGTSYRILFTDTVAGGGHALIGHLVNVTSSGKSVWISTGPGGTFDVGRLHLVGATLPASAGTTSLQDHGGDMGGGEDGGSSGGGSSSGGSSSGGSDDGHGDCDTHEDDDGDAGLCSSTSSGGEDDDEELDCEHDMGDSFDDSGDDDGEEHSDAGTPPPCPGGGSSSGAGSSSGGSSGSSSGAPPPPPPGAGGPGSSCTVTADCQAGLICVSSVCTTPVL